MDLDAHDTVDMHTKANRFVTPRRGGGDPQGPANSNNWHEDCEFDREDQRIHLDASSKTALAGERAGVGKGPVDVAELYAPYTHQELILREALGLGEGVDVNPSGGALAAHPLMVAGLSRFGEAAERIIDGSANRAVAHATSGPCLQQNLVAVLEA